MAITVNVDGVNRSVSASQVNIDGIWRDVKGVSNNIDGVWRPSFGTFDFIITADNRHMIGYDIYDENMTDFIIPETITDNNGIIYNVVGIDDKAFRRNDYEPFYLQSITIPSSVMTIGSTIFYCNYGVISIINVDSGNIKYSSIDGVLFNKNATELVLYPGGKSDTSYNIPDSVTSISDSAFYQCVYLNNVIIPNSVVNIGVGAFTDSSIVTITLPHSIKKINDGTFVHCTSLTTITIPNTVTQIGISAFGYCEALTTVNYTGTEEEWNAISIGMSNDAILNATKNFNYQG